MSGQEIVIEDLHKKPARFEALKGKKIEEVEEYPFLQFVAPMVTKQI